MAEINFESGAAHNITLVGRERLTVTGVSDVASFDDSSVVLETALGVLTVDGIGLKIIRFGPTAGKAAPDSDLVIEGKIGGIFYIDDSVEKKKRLFGRGSR